MKLCCPAWLIIMKCWIETHMSCLRQAEFCMCRQNSTLGAVLALAHFSDPLTAVCSFPSSALHCPSWTGCNSQRCHDLCCYMNAITCMMVHSVPAQVRYIDHAIFVSRFPVQSRHAYTPLLDQPWQPSSGGRMPTAWRAAGTRSLTSQAHRAQRAFLDSPASRLGFCRTCAQNQNNFLPVQPPESFR